MLSTELKKNETILGEIANSMRCGGRGAKTILKEVIEKNFPYLGNSEDISIEEAKRTSRAYNSKQPMPQYIFVKLSENKRKTNAGH